MVYLESMPDSLFYFPCQSKISPDTCGSNGSGAGLFPAEI